MIGVEHKIMGIGCFAGQRTLARVLGRLLEACSPGDWTEVLEASAGGLALQKLISGGSDAARQGKDGSDDEKITGFFLAFENRRPRLSVFLRRTGVRPGRGPTSADGPTRLNRSRLH